MAYLGKQPVRGQNRELDDISGSFNGSTTAFTMQVGGVNTSAGSVNQIFINVGGILQNPGTDFTVAASTLTFTTAPASGLDFWGLIQGDAVDINEPADGSVTEAKLNANAPTNDHVLTADATTSGGFKWAAASGTTINTNADNRVITGSGTANTLNGEANLTYDGNNVNLETDADGEGIVIHAAGNTYNQITLDANRSAATNPVGAIFGKWNGNVIGSMQFNAGTDTTNKDDGYFDLRTAEGGTNTERIRVHQGGNVEIKTGDIIIGTAGQGIDFSVNAGTSKTGATTTSQKFDDYEEGTWTADLRYNWASSCGFSSGPDHKVGTYVKIGNMVFAQCYVYNYTMTSGDGSNANIKGLPYISQNVSNHFWLATFAYNNAFTTDDVDSGYLNKGDDNIRPSRLGDGDSSPNWSSSSSRYFMMQVMYCT